MNYLIIGGGLAAARAVDGIRDLDPDGSITVVTAEKHPPYERPPLSKGVLIGDDDTSVVYPHPGKWYAEHGVELITGDRAASIDPDAGTATLDSGNEIEWDRLLLATGSRVLTLDVPGADLDGIHYLRTLEDATALREAFAAGGDVVVVGAGWIGLEAAAAARSHGCAVTVLGHGDVPLQNVVGRRIGAWFADLHTSHGVEFALGDGVAGFEGGERVEAVLTESGERLPAATVVVGVGIEPDTALAEQAGATIDDGVVTDEFLRSSLPQVWAAGDVAKWRSSRLGRHLRVEHWANAHDGGFAAGRLMAGGEEPYDPVPFFYSDQYDAGLEYAGYVPPEVEAEVVLRGDPASGAFMAFWVVPAGAGVRVLAGMHVNIFDTMDAVQALITGRTVLSADRLADEEVPLQALVGE